jgi:hypothetical protein
VEKRLLHSKELQQNEISGWSDTDLKGAVTDDVTLSHSQISEDDKAKYLMKDKTWGTT